MKLTNKNSKRLSLLFLTGFVISGTIACSSKRENTTYIQTEELQDESITTEELLNDSIGTSEELETEVIISAEIVNQKESIPSTEQLEIEQSPDEIINNYLESEKTKMNQAIDSEDINTIKETITSSFITLVDFIYYDEPIYGVTYDELSEATKENVKESFQLIDTIINECFPDYKENLSSKYNEIKEKGTSIIYEKLGEDNWNQLGNAKDSFEDSLSDVKEVVDDLTESGKTKVKTWYEEFKSNHQ